MRKVLKVGLLMFIIMMISFFAFSNSEQTRIVPSSYSEYEMLYPVNSIEAAYELEMRYGLELIEYSGHFATFEINALTNINQLIEAGFIYNNIVSSIGRPIPLSDPYLNYQYGITITDTDDAWKIEAGSAEIIIAIIDTGIDTNHEEFIGRISSLSYNVTTNQTGLLAIEDDNGHGTMVAGVIGAIRDNKIGIAGITNFTQLMVIKANEDGVDTFKESNIIEAIYYAVDHGANVINLSLGSTYANPLTNEAVNYATDHGVFVVGAAGNEGNSVPMYPASFENAISVSAVDSGSTIAPYSNFNEHVDIAAPGTQIYSTANDGAYATASGTSFAAPHVSGIIALYLSAFPLASVNEVKTLLYAGARDLGDFGYDSYYGYGLVNALSLFLTTYHQVDFVLPEGTFKDSIFVEDGLLLTIGETPVIEHYEFMGWYLDSDYLVQWNPLTAVTEDMTLYGKYELNQYLITWVIEGETPILEYYEPNEVVMAPILSLEHRIFHGWYLDSAYTTYASLTLATGSVTYYGWYEYSLYTFIFYDYDLETIIETKELTYNDEFSLLSGPDKPSTIAFDFEFIAWVYDPLYQNTVNEFYPTYERIFRPSSVGLNPGLDTIYKGTSYLDAGAYTLSDEISISKITSVNTTSIGRIAVYYAVTYEQNNIYYLVRYVNIVQKEPLIIITLKKGVSTLYQGEVYEEKGALTNLGTVEIIGEVNTEIPGVYVITYQVEYLGKIQTAKRYVYVLEIPEEIIPAFYPIKKEDEFNGS